MSVELWLRPWARYAPTRRQVVVAGELNIPDDHAGPMMIYHQAASPLIVDGRPDSAELVTAMTERSSSGVAQHDILTNLSLLPLLMRQKQGVSIATGGGLCRILWPAAPDRPAAGDTPENDRDKLSSDLMLRAEAVWDRIGDVEDALADPARLWDTLRNRWTQDDEPEPRMDMIVHQARELSRTLDGLEARPRRILRRVHRQVPITRVQEIDRRAMLWLARQPGETLAERAGEDQRVLAVAREENFDTLENRVLRAYGDLANRHAREYIDRNGTRRQTRRARLVEAYGKRCARVARRLEERGVRRAAPGVIPNFVLQQNPLYHRIWIGWNELLQREQVKDELWRWQARSWEEFCTLAVVVALMGVPGAQLVASAPLWFRDEQRRGHWIDADPPLGVVYLPAFGLIIEVQNGPRSDRLAGLGAPLWLRIGAAGDVQGFLSRSAIWPIWSPSGGLVPGEAEEVSTVLRHAAGDLLQSGIVIRPARSSDASDQADVGNVLTLTLGTEGSALRDGLSAMTGFLDRFATRRGG